jgi:hypothetical protein
MIHQPSMATAAHGGKAIRMTSKADAAGQLLQDCASAARIGERVSKPE